MTVIAKTVKIIKNGFYTSLICHPENHEYLWIDLTKLAQTLIY